MILGHQAIAAVVIRDVGQAVQRVVSISRRAEHRACGISTGDILPVAHFVVSERRRRPVVMRHRLQAAENVVAVADRLAARRLHGDLVAQNIVVVRDRPPIGRDRLQLPLPVVGRRVAAGVIAVVSIARRDAGPARQSAGRRLAAAVQQVVGVSDAFARRGAGLR